jgi:hypothetical protein
MGFAKEIICGFMLRTIIERLSRVVVLKRRLPKQFGGEAIYVWPHAVGSHEVSPRASHEDSPLGRPPA